MDHQDRAIRRFRLHLAMQLFLKYAVPLATVWSFVWGIAVLALRAAYGIERLPLLWGLLGLAGCAVLACMRMRRSMPAANTVRALLDRQSGCGGLLMAGAEQELGGWRQRLPELQLPRVSWDGWRPASLLAVAAGFVLLTLLAPQGLADLSAESPLQVDQEITRLVEQIAVLKGESMLEPERAERLTRELGDLRQNASGKDPARTLESLDHLRSMARQSARQAAEECMRRKEHLGEAEALATILQQSADVLDSRLKMETLIELAGHLDKQGLSLKQFTSQLDPELLKALREQKLDPEQLSKLSKVLQGSKGELDRQMEQLRKLGLIDAELLAKCQRAGDFDSDQLRAFMQKHPAKGGASRGPGQAALTWGPPRSEERAQFKEEVLPPGALASLKSSPLNLPSGRAGQIAHHKPDDHSESGALKGANAGSGSANTDTILPRHRSAVQRYFERKSEIRNPKSERKSKPEGENPKQKSDGF